MPSPFLGAIAALVWLGILSFGIVLFRLARRNLTDASASSLEPALGDFDENQLRVSARSKWPTRGRWPGPENHAAELETAVRRDAYSRFAKSRAEFFDKAGSLTLLIAAAVLGSTLVPSIRNALRASTPPLGDSDLLVFIGNPLDVAFALLPAAGGFMIAGVAVALTDRGIYLNELSHRYRTLSADGLDSEASEEKCCHFTSQVNCMNSEVQTKTLGRGVCLYLTSAVLVFVGSARCVWRNLRNRVR